MFLKSRKKMAVMDFHMIDQLKQLPAGQKIQARIIKFLRLLSPRTERTRQLRGYRRVSQMGGGRGLILMRGRTVDPSALAEPRNKKLRSTESTCRLLSPRRQRRMTTGTRTQRCSSHHLLHSSQLSRRSRTFHRN